MPKVKDKERILKAAREKQLPPSKGALIGLLVDFSKENLQVRRDWHTIIYYIMYAYYKKNVGSIFTNTLTK